MTIGRREFLGVGASVAGLTLARPGHAAESVLRVFDPARSPRAAVRPVVIASGNDIRGVARAYEMITRQNANPLDAVIAGVNIQELDPEDQSVGFGALPNEDGVVQLDASCMHGPTGRASSVGALEGIATPSLVAKAVMDYTDHVMLVGEGAKKFALQMGFTEQNLLTEKSRQMWRRWKARQNPNDNWLDHDDVKIALTTGTINMNAVTAGGDIASVTTTSGRSKIPGRIGDVPVIGAGQYCDNTVGAAGSTGRGAANLKVCGAFLAVEFMRLGMSPESALMKVMERVIALTETRLLNARGRPYFDLEFYAVADDGRFAGACAYQGARFAVCDSEGARLVESAYLFNRDERPQGRPRAGMFPRR